VAFELVEFCEPAPKPGEPFAGTHETIVGTYLGEQEAIAEGRARWQAAREADTPDVMWWIVRHPGETLARWVADRASEQEHILDLTTNRLVVVQP